LVPSLFESEVKGLQNGRNNTPNSYKFTSAVGKKPNSAAGAEASHTAQHLSRATQQGVPNQSTAQSVQRQGIPTQSTPQSAPRQIRANRSQAQTSPAQNADQNKSQRAPRNINANNNPNRTAAQQNISNSSQVKTAPSQNLNHGSAPARTVSTVPVKPKKESSLQFLKRTFAVDKSVIEQRAIVREQGSYDYIFLILVLVLLAFGTVMVYSSSYAYSLNRYGDSYYIIFRQAVFIIVGLFGMGFAMWFRPEWYKKFAVPIYIVCFFMMSLVPIPGIGVEHKGARRWISLGFTEIQPSEFMKLGLVFMLAWYMDRYYERVTDYKNFWRSTFFGIFVPFAIIGTTCLLVIIEKHLSGTIIMFLIGIIVIFTGGASIKILAALGSVGGLGLLAFGLLTDYTKRRFDIWLNPEAHPQDGGWQTLQGLYAIGSGGFFGVGLGESRQKHMFVSEPQNDFIFTIVCEELGFIGAVSVILLFIMFIYRGFVIAMKAPDIFSSLMVIGIVGKVATQAVLNIAVVTNSIPNTGISLPFFSYGGSSLVILMIEMGVVLSISRFSKQRK
jgi:cell division protein FtsW